MPKQSISVKKSSLSAVEQYELNQWLEENNISSTNLRRSFTDVLPLARLLSRYYPDIIDLNYYPPRNSVQNKLCNWESFNKRVLSKLGLQLTREQMIRVARSVPGSVDQLLYSVMRVHMAAEMKAREEHESTDDYDESVPTATLLPSADTEDKLDEVKPSPLPLPTAPPLMLANKFNKPLGVTKAEDNKDQTTISVKSLKQAAALPPTAMKRTGLSRGGTGIGGGGTQRTGRNKRQLQQHRNAHVAAAAAESPSAATATTAATPARATASTTTASRLRGEQVSVLPKQRMVLYSIYMQAANQLQRRNAKIARFDQWSAHLENMLQLKCERIDELQRQVAVAMLGARQVGRRARHKKRHTSTTIGGMLEAAKRL